MEDNNGEVYSGSSGEPTSRLFCERVVIKRVPVHFHIATIERLGAQHPRG